MPDANFGIGGFISDDRIVVVTEDFIGLFNDELTEVTQIIMDKIMIDYKHIEEMKVSANGSHAVSRHYDDPEGCLRVWDLNNGALTVSISTKMYSFDIDKMIN